MTDRLRIESGSFAAEVDPVGARAASIVHRRTGTEFLLQTPWRDEHWDGAYPPTRSDEEWHRRYPGGWHTLVPHSGGSRAVDGVEHPFHGEAAWRRWRTVAVEAASCTLEIVLRTAPLTVRRHLRATGTGVAVHQSVVNQAAAETAFGWTEHPAFGEALIGPDTTVRIGDDPVDAHFPEEGEPHGGFREVPAEGRPTVAVRNAAKGTEAALRFDPELFPYVHLWQEHRKTLGFPWWGLTDTVALEPASQPYEWGGEALGTIVLPGRARIEADFDLELRAGPRTARKGR